MEVPPASTRCRDRTAPAHPVPALGTNPSTTLALQAQKSAAPRHRSETILSFAHRARGSSVHVVCEYDTYKGIQTAPLLGAELLRGDVALVEERTDRGGARGGFHILGPDIATNDQIPSVTATNLEDKHR